MIINKVKDLRTNSLGATNGMEGGSISEDFDYSDINPEKRKEMSVLFDAIKSSMKLPKDTSFNQVLKSIKKVVAKRTFKEKQKKKTKPKPTTSKVAVNYSKIELPVKGGFKKKVSPSRGISPASNYTGPSSARNDKSFKINFTAASIPMVAPTGRFQPSQQSGKSKRTKKSSSSS